MEYNLCILLRAKDHENRLNEISSGLEFIGQSSSPNEDTTSLISKLRKSIFEKQNKNKNILNRLAVKAMLNGGKEYLETKSQEFDIIAGDPSLRTEPNLQIFQSELSVFQDKLSRDVESELPKLDQKSRTEFELLKNEFDTDCSALVDNTIELSKKAK